MALNEFGGDWTEQKLDRLRKYLPAYTTIMRGNPTARALFQTIYVDAFAGTGYVTPRQKSTPPQDPGVFNLFETMDDASEEALWLATVPETQAFLDGSARIALDVEPPFDRYIFIDKKAAHVRDLKTLRLQHYEMRGRIEVRQGDGNEELIALCDQTDWRTQRAVVFLDPFGMQVNWDTIQALGTKAEVDLWLLFPLGMAVNRLLTRNALPPDDWARALDRALGTPDWRTSFYTSVLEPPPNRTLFDALDEEAPARERIVKTADFAAIGQFFVQRLASVFSHVAPQPLTLSSNRGVPLYLLCFASQNEAALNIAKHLLKP